MIDPATAHWVAYLTRRGAPGAFGPFATEEAALELWTALSKASAGADGIDTESLRIVPAVSAAAAITWLEPAV